MVSLSAFPLCNIMVGERAMRMVCAQLGVSVSPTTGLVSEGFVLMDVRSAIWTLSLSLTHSLFSLSLTISVYLFRNVCKIEGDTLSLSLFI